MKPSFSSQHVFSPTPVRVDPVAARNHLKSADPVLAEVINRVGFFRLDLKPPEKAFQTLFSSIVAQQLSNAVAENILKRVLALFPVGETIGPDEIIAVPEVQLRLAGLSFSKIAAVKDLAAKALSGFLPQSSAFELLTDEEIRNRLGEIRGIGSWTADMFLIFHLNRPDVLPLSDQALKRSVARTYSLKDLPEREELARIGEPWRPFRSVASWYLWKSLDHF